MILISLLAVNAVRQCFQLLSFFQMQNFRIDLLVLLIELLAILQDKPHSFCPKNKGKSL